MKTHVCYTAENIGILCLCMTGKDHDEFDFDNPDADDYIDDDTD